MDPRERSNWAGFLEALQPPPGYKLAAAIGTTFGLSLEALVGALLSMCHVDGEALQNDPVAAVIAATRLGSSVRVLVHPATISGGQSGSRKVVGLLDRVCVEVQPRTGLFHPKVWALRFCQPEGEARAESDVGRVIVCSRNLGQSTSFEIAAVLEGKVQRGAQEAHRLCGDVSDALQSWLGLAPRGVRIPKVVEQLPAFLRRVAVQLPEEGEAVRLRWQGGDRASLVSVLPKRCRRMVIVSPFVQPEFVKEVVQRTAELQLISTSEALDGLDDATVAMTDQLRDDQEVPVLYRMELGERQDLDDTYLDGLHAKLIVAEDDEGNPLSLLGSANATGPGWGIGGVANVEAMVELRPGLGVDAFVRGFVRDRKTGLHPWIREYERADATQPDETAEAERQLLADLREAAKVRMTVSYDEGLRRLTLSCDAGLPKRVEENADVVFSAAPFLLCDRPGGWQSLSSLASSPVSFIDVGIEELTAFVAVKAVRESRGIEKTRLVLARLGTRSSWMLRHSSPWIRLPLPIRASSQRVGSTSSMRSSPSR